MYIYIYIYIYMYIYDVYIEFHITFYNIAIFLGNNVSSKYAIQK